MQLSSYSMTGGHITGSVLVRAQSKGWEAQSSSLEHGFYRLSPKLEVVKWEGEELKKCVFK